MIIPYVHHFLSHLQDLHKKAKRCRKAIEINNQCVKDLVLVKKFIKLARQGIDMNLLAYHCPDRVIHFGRLSIWTGRV